LVELLLVIAIIGILAAVLFVSLGKQRERARITTFKENTRGLVTTYTACTDGGGSLGTTLGGAACISGPSAIGNIPNMTDCDGEDTDNTIEISSTDDEGDTWMFQATCNTSAGTCIANCTADGCVYCNTALTYADGVWSGDCDDSNCQ
jgi:type II secretory pathway pseudopilin PulG